MLLLLLFCFILVVFPPGLLMVSPLILNVWALPRASFSPCKTPVPADEESHPVTSLSLQHCLYFVSLNTAMQRFGHQYVNLGYTQLSS